MDLVCTWLTGPDSGTEQRITWDPGPDGTTLQVVIGRAGPICCDDPRLQPHHVLLEARAILEPDGAVPASTEVWATQLAGTEPVRTPSGALRGRMRLDHDARLAVGGSTCAVRIDTTPRRAGDALAAAVDARGSEVVRAPRRVPSAADLALVAHLQRLPGVGSDRAVPAAEAHARAAAMSVPARERPGGLVPMLIGLAGSAAIAIVTGRPLFLLFGAVGSLVALSSWIGQWLAFGRRHRRAVDEHRHATRREAERRIAARQHARTVVDSLVPSLRDALSTIANRSPSLWACRAADLDAFLVGVGIGEIRLDQVDSTRPTAGPAQSGGPCSAALTADAPVPAALAPGEHLAIVGPLADAVARSMVAQLAARCGPADVQIVADAAGWDWAHLLPHARGSHPTRGAPRPDAVGPAPSTSAAPHLVVVTDQVAALGDPTSWVRRLLDRSSATLIAICRDAPAPSCSTALLDTRCRPAAFTPDVRHGGDVLAVEIAGLGLRRAVASAAALTGLRDPEAIVEMASRLPASVDLDELENVDDVDRCNGGTRQPRSTATGAAVHHRGGGIEPDAVMTRWSRCGQSLRIPIGVALDSSGRPETAWLDLVAEGPHALIAGTTGSGKSELVRSLVVGLARAAPPSRMAMVLVDYKGGATFDALAALPHVAGVVTDLDDRMADRMLRSLAAEMRSREAWLRRLGAADLDTAYRSHPHAGAPPRLVVVIDEFAALVAERPSFLHALVGIAQRGRSLGLHLVLATQRPAGVVSDDIRANTSVRIALRLHDRADALDVVGDDSPVAIGHRTPGRAVLRDGERRIEVQTARCSRLDAAVEAISRATELAGHASATAPWKPPLPAVLDSLPHSLDAASVTGTPTHYGVDPLPAAVVGIIDDPDRQQYRPLAVPDIGMGLIVAGSRGSGVSSTLAAVAAATSARYGATFVIEPPTGHRRTQQPSDLHDPWHALDTGGHVQRLGAGDDRLLRLVRAWRENGSGTRPPTLVVLDGIDALRRVLAGPAHDHRPEHRHESQFDQLVGALLQPGSSIDVAIGAVDPAAVPPALLARCDDRWALHLADPGGAAAIGISPRTVPAPVAGRLTVGGFEAQVLSPAAVLSAGPMAGPTRNRLEHVPDRITRSSLAPAPSGDPAAPPHGAPVVGIDLETGHPVGLGAVHADAVLVVGPAGSGRTTAARSIAAALRDAQPLRAVVVVEAGDTTAGDGTAVDGTGEFAAGAHAARPTVVVCGTGDEIRRRSDWWSSMARRSRCGVVLAGPEAAADGDLLGVALPRGFPVAVRPGRGWLVDHGTITPVQLAIDDAARTRLGDDGTDCRRGAASAAAAATRDDEHILLSGSTH